MKIKVLPVCAILIAVNLLFGARALAATGYKTADELAQAYVQFFNKKDLDSLLKLRYPGSPPSELQSMMDEMLKGQLAEGMHIDKYEVLPVAPEMTKPMMGLDGKFYKTNLTPTNTIKFSASFKNADGSGSSSSTIPIGQKNGLFYEVSPVVSDEASPEYKFGWQRFTPLNERWSVLMPNEPEPGKAALEKGFGKDSLNDPDIYGVVKNTASIKTTQRFYRSGEPGKRIDDKANKETFRLTYTTYDPATLKEYFSDADKTLDEAVNSQVRFQEGTLVKQKSINGKFPGRDFEVKGKDGSLTVGRVYWLEDRLCELVVTSQKAEPDLSAAGKFLNSLEVN